MAAGTLSDSDWAAPLEPLAQLRSEFIEAARPSSILLQLSNARRVPLRTKVSRISVSATAGWVAEGLPKPVTELALNAVSLEPTKAACIVVCSEELSRASSPAADALIRADLIASINATIDGAFVSNAAASTGKPAAFSTA